ncbi:hypothetical protein DER44DRAFT_806639 [Fusarium oxysporum]|nr:hypothetical protein DER44DRAFT_806639 [Fusarium oxysporum]
MPANKSFPLVVDVWANPTHNRIPETERLFKQSHADPALFSKKLSPGQIVALMDEAGVSQICLSAWNRPGSVIASNEEIAEYTRAFPNRIFGLVSVDLHDPVSAVKDLDHYVRKEGFKGLRVVPWLWNLPPTDAHYWPLFVKCIELDVPFLTQVGHTGPLCPSEVGRPIPYIDEIALKFPDLKIICGHLGYPWAAEMVSVAWKHPNVYIDTSAWSPKYYDPAFITFANTTGRKKVMFGTNFPQLTWKDCVNNVHKGHGKNGKGGLKEEVLDDFIGGNAKRVLKLPDWNDKEAQSKLRRHTSTWNTTLTPALNPEDYDAASLTTSVSILSYRQSSPTPVCTLYPDQHQGSPDSRPRGARLHFNSNVTRKFDSTMQLNLPPRLLRIIIGCIITSVILVVSIALLIPSRHFDPANPPSSNSESKTWFPLLQQKPSWTTEQLEPKFAYAHTSYHRIGMKAELILILDYQLFSSPHTSEQAKAIDNIRSKHPHIHLRPMDVISTSKGDATWRDSLTKFQSFSLTEWTRILAFDSDSLVLNTMDHYFLSPMAPLAVPRAYWLNEQDTDIAKQVLGSHVMLLEPSKARYDKIIKEALQSGEFDMEVINHMFRDSAMILPHRRLALLTGEFRAKNHSQYLAPDEDEEWNAMAERLAIAEAMETSHSEAVERCAS